MESQQRLFRNHLILAVLISILFIISITLSYKNGLFEGADHFIYDLHFKWRGYLPTSEKVVLVFMDQKSASELKREKGAWSRSRMTRALENLCRAGAEIIGMDLVLFAPSGKVKDDISLSRAIDRCGNVVLAKFVAVEGRGEVAPLSIFKDGMLGDGFINMFPDRDGVLRKIPFLSIKPVKDGVAVSPSFSLEIVRAYLDLDFVFDFSQKDHFLLGGKGNRQIELPYPDLRIHYYGREDVFTRLSYADVVQNRFSPGDIKGKIVLIGSSLATDKDFFDTPFSGYRTKGRTYKDRFGEVVAEDIGTKTAGVACHAHAIETILNGKFIRACQGKYVVFLILVCGCLGMIFYFQRPGALWGVFILLALVGVITGISHAVFVNHLIWVEIVPFAGILLIQYISGIGFQRAYSKKKTKIVTAIFGKYVSRGVVNDILKGDIGASLEGRSQEVTVLFSDLRSFTTLSEGLTPLETGQLLNTYFDAMIPIVFDHKGTLDKLIGDAIMAFFGAPGELQDHPVKAAETALKMIDRLDALKSEKQVKGIKMLEVGIGLNTGQVTVGNLGSRSFMDYTIIGDTVNLGSRLEGLNKTYGTSIIIGQLTAARLDNRFVIRELDRVKVKGKEDAVTIFELSGLRDGLDRKKIELLEIFKSGLDQYKNRDWNQAEKTFNKALKVFPEDGPSRLYLSRTRELISCPPSSEWEYITVFSTK